MDNVNIEFRVNDSTAEVVAPAHVVVDCVTLGFGGLHRVGSSTLFGKVNNRVWLFRLDQVDQQIVVLGNIEVDKLDILATDLLPRLNANLRRIFNRYQWEKCQNAARVYRIVTPQLQCSISAMSRTTYLHGLNGSKRIAAEFCVNISPTQVVDNDNVVSLITEIEGCGPSTEAIASKNNDLFLLQQPILTIGCKEGCGRGY